MPPFFDIRFPMQVVHDLGQVERQMNQSIFEANVPDCIISFQSLDAARTHALQVAQRELHHFQIESARF